MTGSPALMRDVPPYSFEEGVRARHPWIVCIFAYDEGPKLARQLARFPDAAARDYDLMVGDDGSTDGSCPPELVTRFGLRGITRLDHHRGQSPSIKAGLDWILRQGYAGMVMMNGNDRDGVDAVPRFIEKLAAGYGYVQGSRFIPGGEHVNTPPYREWAIRGLHAPLFSLIVGRRLTDTTNGFRGFSSEALRAMGDGLFNPGFTHYEMEQYLAWKALRCGFRHCEIPVARRYQADWRTRPYSKIRPGLGWWHMLKPLLGLLTHRYP